MYMSIFIFSNSQLFCYFLKIYSLCLYSLIELNHLNPYSLYFMKLDLSDNQHFGTNFCIIIFLSINFDIALLASFAYNQDLKEHRNNQLGYLLFQLVSIKSF